MHELLLPSLVTTPLPPPPLPFPPPHTRSSLSLRPAWCGERARWVGGQIPLSSPVPSLAAPPSPPAVPLTMHLSNNCFHHSRVLSSPDTMGLFLQQLEVALCYCLPSGMSLNAGNYIHTKIYLCISQHVVL